MVFSICPPSQAMQLNLHVIVIINHLTKFQNFESPKMLVTFLTVGKAPCIKKYLNHKCADFLEQKILKIGINEIYKYSRLVVGT